VRKQKLRPKLVQHLQEPALRGNAMFNQSQRPKDRNPLDGFSLAEAIITTAIIGTISSIAYPTYINVNNSAKAKNAEAMITTIPTTIGAYIDETGEIPDTWEDLSNISVIMTNNGPAAGPLSTPITLPRSNYNLTVKGPTNFVYTLTATRLIDVADEDEEEVNNFAIKSCFNISNGASDLKSGDLSDIEKTLNCG
jgi:type II secretory pathway pseudopilin PulG